MIKVLVVSLFCFFLFLILHVIIFHNFDIKRKFRALIGMAIVVSLLGLVTFDFIPQISFLKDKDNSLYLLSAVLLYFFYYFFYFHLLIVMDRSVSVRMLVEIYQAGEKGISLEQIKARYNLTDKFSDELKDLVFLKRLAMQGESFRNTSKGIFHAKAFEFLRNYLNLARNR